MTFSLFVCLMVFNAPFNNVSVILWRSVLLAEETTIQLVYVIFIAIYYNLNLRRILSIRTIYFQYYLNVVSVSCSVVSVSNNVSPSWIDTDHLLSKLLVRLLNTVIPTVNTGVVGVVAVVVPGIKNYSLIRSN